MITEWGGSSVHELVTDEVVSLGSVEGDSVTLTDNLDFGSKSEGRLLFRGAWSVNLVTLFL